MKFRIQFGLICFGLWSLPLLAQSLSGATNPPAAELPAIKNKYPAP